jgi:hypothetical protein
MKHTSKTMTIFLILIIGSSIQFSANKNPQDSFLKHSSDSVVNLKNNKIVEKAIHEDPSNQISGNEVDMAHTNNLVKPKKNKKSVLTTSYRSPARAKLYYKQTRWNTPGRAAINFLDRHTIDCSERNSAINSFKFEWNRRNKIRYSYTCVNSPVISNKCHVLETNLKNAEFVVTESLDSLVKHYVECPENHVMSRFRLKNRGKFFIGLGAIFRLLPQDHPKLYYQYTCCQADTTRVIFARTNRSPNLNNEYGNLTSQNVKGYDKVALNYFHMQTPGDQIYYEMKFANLKGETSPSYPDYFSNGFENSFMGKIFL